MRTRNLRLALWTGLVVLVAATPANANMLIPLVAVGWIAMVVLLVPIIAIETLFLSFRLGGAFWQALWVTTLTNLASTFVGIPIACFLHQYLRGVFPFRIDTRWHRFLTASVHAPWEIGANDEPDERLGLRMEMHASFALLVVFFLASWFLEASIAIALLPHIEPNSVHFGVLLGNLATYGLLAWYVWDESKAFLEEPKKQLRLPAPDDFEAEQSSLGPAKVEPLRRTERPAGEQDHKDREAA